MTKQTIHGREIYKGVSTDEVIELFEQTPNIDLECSGGITRWLKYDARNKKIGITDNIHYDWYSLKDFRKYYGSRYWFFFIL